MSEQLTGLAAEAHKPDSRTEVGRITVLEALAQESTAVSPDMSRRSTLQGRTDYEDD